jgi:hypothetical protein
MPPLTRWYIKIGLAHLALALVVGVLLAAQPVLALPAEIGLLRPVFLHLFIVGWVTQLIFGVAYWMFPKQSKAHPRGSARLGWGVLILLNLGLLLRAVGEPLLILQPSSGAGVALALSAALQVAAGWMFIANTWTRVKER